jgi:membrane protein
LTEMWWEQPFDSPGFVRNKISDLWAILWTFLVILATLGLSALGHAAPMEAVLRWLEIPEFLVFDWIIRGISIFVSMLVSWLLFTWMIGRLPRESVRLVAAMKAGLMAAIGFELFKQVASIYLQAVLRSPAGATFGPVLGLMVFAYVTSFLVLFCAAWAATASGDPRAKPVDPPAPTIIAPRIQLDEGISARQTLAALTVGAVGALAISRFAHWRR